MLFVPRREHGVLYRETLSLCCVNHTEYRRKKSFVGKTLWLFGPSQVRVFGWRLVTKVCQSVLVSNTPRAYDEALNLISGTAPKVVEQVDARGAGWGPQGGSSSGGTDPGAGRSHGCGWDGKTGGAVRLVNCWTVVNMYWLYRKAQCGPRGEHNTLPLKKTS